VGLNFYRTDDTSWTARHILDDAEEGESMHSLRGAFSETVYIYGDANLWARQHISSSEIKVFSLGLGLGYVEILSAAYALAAQSPISGVSFEADAELTHAFQAWLLANSKPGVVPFEIYEDILQRAAQQASVEPVRLRQELASALLSKAWILNGALTPDSSFVEARACHVIAFDAFSRKTTPELWTREFLDRFLSEVTASKCVLSTYACTGDLKRALLHAGFNLQIRPGFAAKRDSTFATRA
jgi:hypothetical protein